MKKEDITGTIVYLLVLGFGAVFVFTFLRDHAAASGMSNVGYIFFNLGALVAGIVFNAIIFELAHILGALVGGYSIISVNILRFNWRKEGDKVKFLFSDYDGLTGETKIVPKEGNKKEANPYGYLLFGSLFIVAETIAAMVVFSMYRNEIPPVCNVAYFLLTVDVVGLMIFIYNILPFKLDSMTDGYRLTQVSNPKNRAAFNELLKTEYNYSQGKEVESQVFTEITNYTAELNLNKAYACLNEKKFDEAETIFDTIVNAKENVSAKVYIRAKAQKVYLHLVKNDMETAAKFYDENVPVSERREICDDNSMACIRAYILMSGLLDKSRSECIIAINKVTSAYKKTPEGRKEVEKELFNEALKKVHEAHTKWELDKYYLK